MISSNMALSAKIIQVGTKAIISHTAKGAVVGGMQHMALCSSSSVCISRTSGVPLTLTIKIRFLSSQSAPLLQSRLQDDEAIDTIKLDADETLPDDNYNGQNITHNSFTLPRRCTKMQTISVMIKIMMNSTYT
mmetsp:Transcript_2580/g.4792  ORF Transcript_2580/g.4792 Transcript_2580/m.4792 type:complete len:133 (-) Transcript_2580:90-488(-)